MKLRQSHPNLFLGMFILGLWSFALGIAFMEGKKEEWIDMLAGAWFTNFGLLTMVGCEFSFRLAKVGMGFSMGGAMMIGIGLAIGLWPPHYSIQTIMWIGYAILQLSPMAEPSINPLTRKENDERG